MPNSGEEKMRVDAVIHEAIKKTSDVAMSIQRQAPAARMVGEFAVKQVIKELEKISQRITAQRDQSNT